MALFTLYLKATFAFNFLDSSAMLVQGTQHIINCPCLDDGAMPRTFER